MEVSQHRSWLESSDYHASMLLNCPCAYFNWAPRHKGVLGEWRYSYTHSLTSTLDGGEWSASRPGSFTPGKRAPGTPWIGGWVGLRAVLDAVAKRKIPSPRRDSNPRTPIIQPVAQWCTDWDISALSGAKISRDRRVGITDSRKLQSTQVRVVSSGMMFIPTFMKRNPLVQNFVRGRNKRISWDSTKTNVHHSYELK
jgi:hypothetical protein